MEEVKAPEEAVSAPMELWSVDDAVNAGEAEEKLVPRHMYSSEDIVDLCEMVILRHRHKTDWHVPCIYDSREFLAAKIQEVVAEAARPSPEVVFNKWHDVWLAIQLKAGWQYGEIYSVSEGGGFDPEWKQSPLIMPFIFTPPEYQAIGHIYWNTVRSLMHFRERGNG